MGPYGWTVGSGHSHGSGSGDRRRLAVALAVVLIVLVVEVAGGILTGSLALLSDAGHMASDAIGLGVALVASVVAARPPTDRHTYGFQRVEVLGALVNGVLLTVLAVSITVEAARRLAAPETIEVLAGPMLIVAALGLLANAGTLLLLRGGNRRSLNLRGAYLEVLGDLIGSVVTVAAAIALLLFGFVQADALGSLAIAVLIAPRAFLLLRDVARVLTESAPRETDVAAIRRHLLETRGVVNVHDVHVWAITSGSPVFSAHVVAAAEVFSAGRTGQLLDDLGECLSDHFDVAHSTFQLEPAEHAAHEEHHHR
jgi:cobalt-zinc-cadmium efflux system protein